MGDDGRTEFVGIRVTPRERREWTRRARAEGMSFSEWLLAPRRQEGR